jgi:uncharacterized protein DUF87
VKALFEKAVVVLCLGAIIILGLVFLSKFNTPMMDSIGVGAATFFSGLWTALVVVFWLAVTATAAVIIVRIRQMMTTQVIRDDKSGQPVRAVIHKGELVPLMPQGLDANQAMQQIAQMKQLWQMLGTASTSMKNMAKFMDELDFVDADEDETEEIEGTETTKQLAPPRAEPQVVTLHLSDDVVLPANDFLSGRKLIVGTSGSGKSNTVGAYGEELGKLGVPFVLADTEDEYQPLCDPRWLKNGVKAGVGTRYPVTMDNAPQFGSYVLTHRLQVVLNLQSYEFEEAALIMIGIIQGMREWQEELANEDRIPCDFILEEAVTWLPQNVGESPLHGKETFNLLQGTFFNDLVRKGRKRGLGLTLVCQKIAELDKRAMQSDAKILHRQTELPDLERYRKFGITKEDSLSLGNGECFLFTTHVSKMRAQIRWRNSPHGAKTPGIEALRKQRNESEDVSVDEFIGNSSGNAETPGNASGNTLETPSEANPKIIDGVFPNTAKVTEELTENSPTSAVSSEIRETIKRLVAMKKIPHRDIAKVVGLGGRNYPLYQQVCQEEGIVISQAGGS